MTTLVDNLTREQLEELYDVTLRHAQETRPEDEGFGAAWMKENEIRHRLRTLCNNCGREGAEDHYDRERIYAGRWHARCATPSDTHRTHYRWRVGDEPLLDALGVVPQSATQ